MIVIMNFYFMHKPGNIIIIFVNTTSKLWYTCTAGIEKTNVDRFSPSWSVWTLKKNNSKVPRHIRHRVATSISGTECKQVPVLFTDHIWFRRCVGCIIHPATLYLHNHLYTSEVSILVWSVDSKPSWNNKPEWHVEIQIWRINHQSINLYWKILK